MNKDVARIIVGLGLFAGGLALLLQTHSCSSAEARPAGRVCGGPCGECEAGTFTCARDRNGVLKYAGCVYPGANPLEVKASADTGARQVFSPESYSGTNTQKITQASVAAQAVGGAVVLDQIYEITASVPIYSGVLYTGGGLARVCDAAPQLTAPLIVTDNCVQVADVTGIRVGFYVLTTGVSYFDVIGSLGISSINTETNQLCGSGQFNLAAGTNAYMVRQISLMQMIDTTQHDIVIDSMTFDGRSDCNNYLFDWRYNNTFGLRGRNTLKNSLFYRTPSENVTTCGATIENNVGIQLTGSFIHKSCPTTPEAPIDFLVGNYVDGANIGTDAVMEHSEGVMTLSNNAGKILSFGNTFKNGSEGAFGLASGEDRNIVTYNDCYAHFPRMISLYSDAESYEFRFVETTLVDVDAICVGAPCE